MTQSKSNTEELATIPTSHASLESPDALTEGVTSPQLTVDKEDRIDVQLIPKIIQNETFFIQERYVIQEVVGRGSYGMVVSGYDSNTQSAVAIKKCGKVFPTGQAEEILLKNRDQKMSKSALLRQTLIPKRILREMKILTHLNHPNIINLKAIVPPPSYGEFRDVYMVTEVRYSSCYD
jgi:serine/threonine protein kinase